MVKKDPEGFMGNIIAINKLPKPNNTLVSLLESFFIKHNFRIILKIKTKKIVHLLFHVLSKTPSNNYEDGYYMLCRWDLSF